jgi:hypothetical protein
MKDLMKKLTKMETKINFVIKYSNRDPVVMGEGDTIRKKLTS